MNLSQEISLPNKLAQIKTFYWFLLICLAGSVVRLSYGMLYQPWNSAIDQSAWQMIIDSFEFRYDNLIYYPHEGGSIIITLYALFFKMFGIGNSLTVVAFFLDIFVRYLQIRITAKVFGNRIGIFYGLWTIFASSIILPWATVNFGLHSISSVFPFILIWFLHQNKSDSKSQVLVGLFLGLAIWFSYSNLILVPVYVIFHLVSKNSIKIWWLSVICMLLVMFLHLIVRLNFDAGFHLSEMGIGTIRGTNFQLLNSETWEQFQHTFSSLVNGATNSSDPKWTFPILKNGYLLLLVLAFFGIITILRKGSSIEKNQLIGLFSVPFFLALYTLSPFFYFEELGNFVVYRHLTYIIPLVSLFIIVGLNALPLKNMLLTVFLLISTISSSLLFLTIPASPNEIITKAQGWALSTKLGHEPKRLMKIINHQKENRELLYQGVGWGMGAALFENADKFSNQELNNRIYRLSGLVKQYDISNQKEVKMGIAFSFSDQVFPRLNEDIGVLVLEQIEKTN